MNLKELEEQIMKNKKATTPSPYVPIYLYDWFTIKERNFYGEEISKNIFDTLPREPWLASGWKILGQKNGKRKIRKR